MFCNKRSKMKFSQKVAKINLVMYMNKYMLAGGNLLCFNNNFIKGFITLPSRDRHIEGNNSKIVYCTMPMYHLTGSVVNIGKYEKIKVLTYCLFE